MNGIDLGACFHELYLIKTGEEDEKPFRSKFPTLLKERGKSALKYGLGMGLGAGSGYLFGEKVLPKLLPKSFTPTQEKVIGAVAGGLGTLAGLAKWEAYREAARLEAKALKE